MNQFRDGLHFDADTFSGRVRLFPLPNLVLFPHVIQPLHVFEPRYVDLLHEALAGDKLIGMSLLSPGWETDYEGRPPIAPVACLAKVLTWQALPQSKFNLLLVGVRRVRLLHELPPDKSFREAEVEVLDDLYANPAEHCSGASHKKLLSAFEVLLPTLGQASNQLNPLAADSISLGALTDVVSYALDLNVAQKQELLDDQRVERRAERLLAHLRDAGDEALAAPVGSDFPPDFSSN